MKIQPARRGVVLFSAQDYWYHNRAHSDFQLIKGVAADRAVLLVNSIGMRMPLVGGTTQPWRRILRKAASIAKSVRRPEPTLPNLVVMSPLILPLYGSRRGRALNARLVAIQVRMVLRWMDLRRPDVMITIPTAIDVLPHLVARSLAVNRSDLFSSFPEADQALIARMEQDLVSRADVVLYVSHELMKAEKHLAGDRGHFIGHGVDIEHFTARQTPPGDIQTLERPLIGFFGGLDDYVVDFDLIGRLADHLEQGTVVLIGDATCDMSALTARRNLCWLGAREYAAIPAYGAAFDVAIMPWLDNEWIRNCNPIKAKEYLALGVPVVTTAYPEAEPFSSVMAIAHSQAEFLGLIDQAVSGAGRGTPSLRRAAIENESWLTKSKELMRLIDGVDS